MDGFIPDSEFLPDEAAPAAAQAPAAADFIPEDQFVDDEEKYGTLGQQVKTGLEGAASAATFGLSTELEKKLGVDPADIMARREANPGSHTVGQIGGLLGTALIPGLGEANALKVMTGAGNLGARALGLGAAESIAGRMGATAVKMAVENGLFQAGDEVSKMFAEDPNQSVETAVSNVGLSGLVGLGFGGVLGAVNPLAKAAMGKMKAPQFLEDWKSRVKWHANNPEPVEALSQELDDLYRGAKSSSDEVYGPRGLKAQEAQKLMPEMSEKIAAQAQSLVAATEKAIEKLGDDPLSRKLTKKLEEFRGSLSGEIDPITGVPKNAPSPGQIFDAAEGFKQELQAWSKFNKIAPPPIAEREFVRAAKDLSHTFRTALEDSKVWGKVAERQGTINKAFSEYLPTLKNFESKFTTEIAGERVIDPGKVTTFMNQVGKMSGSVRREMLGNFIEASEKYMDVIADSHSSLGLASPMERKSLAIAKEMLKEMSPGAKAADMFVKKSLAKLSGDTAGAAAGTALGAATGMPFGAAIGAVLGQQVLGDVFEKMLPALAKSLLENPGSASALRGSMEYGKKVIDGRKMLENGTRAIFKSSREVLPSKVIETSDSEREKLKKTIADTRKNPERLLAIGGEAGEYLPAHAQAMGETTARVLSYLEMIEPKTERLAPLDDPIEPSLEEREAYNRALDIANKPLSVLQLISNNTLLPDDVKSIATMYPALYASISQALTNQMIDNTANAEPVPYSVRQSLSLFLGQPLDSTLTPIGIQAAQMSFMAKNAPPPAPGGAPKKGNTDKLAKVGDRYQTQEQGLIARQSKS